VSPAVVSIAVTSINPYRVSDRVRHVVQPAPGRRGPAPTRRRPASETTYPSGHRRLSLSARPPASGMASSSGAARTYRPG
jgi:hypothetical protein